MDNDYDMRAEATLTKRLIRTLADLGVLGDRALIELAYPGMDAIEEAEAGEIL